MKKNAYWVYLVVILLACNKDPNNPPEEKKFRLARIEFSSPANSNVYKTNFTYTADGRISKIEQVLNNDPPTLFISVSYNGNEITITKNITSLSAIEDWQIKYTIDASGRPIKRIHYYTKSRHRPTPTIIFYGYDTTTYEFDNAGLIIKETGTKYDSANDNGFVGTVSRANFITNYTVSGGNYSNSFRVQYTKGFNHYLNGTIENFDVRHDLERTFEYSNNYPNKFDFSNYLVFNETGHFPLLLNKGFKNLPDKIIETATARNTAGAVVSTATNTYVQTLEFNPDGYLFTRFTNYTSPGWKYTYFYE